MSEMYANLKALAGCLQEAQGVFTAYEEIVRDVVLENDLNQIVYEDPVSTNSGTAQVLAYLNRARQSARDCESLKRYGFDAEIESIAVDVKESNKRLVRLARFLSWLVDQYEQTEAEVASLLGDCGMLPASEEQWVSELKVPIGTRHTFGGIIGDVIEGDLKSPFTSEDDKWGVQFSVFSVTIESTVRDPSGNKTTSTRGVDVGTVNALLGGEYVRALANANPDAMVPYNDSLQPIEAETGPSSRGVDVGLGIVSVSGSSKNEATGESDGLSIGVAPPKGKASKGFTAMSTNRPDGSFRFDFGIPETPIGLSVDLSQMD